MSDLWDGCPVNVYDPANYGQPEPMVNCPDHDGPCDCTVSAMLPDVEAQFKAWVAERYRQRQPELRRWPDFEDGA